jgi:hypothetical protein
MADNTELPIVKRNPGLDADFMAHLAKVRILQPVYPLFHASVIRGALSAAIPSADGMIVDVGDVQKVGDCRYAITTKDHAGQTYRITIQVEP